MGRPLRVQTVTLVNLLHRELHRVHSVQQGRMMTTMTHQQCAQCVPLESTHLGIRTEQRVAPNVQQDTAITTAIHQQHVKPLPHSVAPVLTQLQAQPAVLAAQVAPTTRTLTPPHHVFPVCLGTTPAQVQQRAQHVSRGSSTKMKTLPPPALSVQLAKSAQSVSLHVWIAQQAQPTSVALQRMWHVQPVQRVNMLPHSPQAAQTALPASTTQSGPRHRAKHVRMVAFLKLPPHHARSARQGRVMLTVIQPQRVQRVPLASTLQLDRTELMARSQAVYHVQRVSMMMTATLHAEAAVKPT